MPELHELLERRASRYEPSRDLFDRVLDRRSRRDRNRRVATAVVALTVAAAGIGGLVRSFSPGSVPGSEPRRPSLGVFEPAAGRIVYVNDGIDRGYDRGLWAVDPSGPSDTVEGVSVADEVASTLVPLDLEEAPRDWSNGNGLQPLGWSSDGTELLVTRWKGFEGTYYVLHADGTETRLNEDPMLNAPQAAISPDGSRVAFVSDGLNIVDVEGGRVVRLPYPADGEPDGGLTFSPDGTRIAYLSGDGVWVVNADGTDAHEIVANGTTRNAFAWFSGMQWSPAGDRIAIGLGGDAGIYTFAPDGSDFTKVITGGVSPYWSPDGSQIAYTIPCDEHPNASCPEGSPRRSLFDPQPGDPPVGLAIADPDGSNVRAFGFAASGPWHPVPGDQPTSPPAAPSESVLRRAGEVLLFTGTLGEGLGDLVAVNPKSGKERVLIEDVAHVSNARWSADGRWVAFEMAGSLWVVDQRLEPRLLFQTSPWVLWTWSSTGARLAVIRGSTLSVVDPSTGQTTRLASTVGDVTSVPAWSPDGTRIVFGARGGSVYSVDVRTGERSLVVQLPGEDLDSIDGIAWSPDGSRLVIYNDLQPGDGRLFVLNPDGSDIHVLADNVFVFGFDWSPDGSRITFTEDHGTKLHVFVAPGDGSTRSLVASLRNNGAGTNPVWSPDGSRIALGQGHNEFLSEDGQSLVIEADGSGDAVPLDDLTYKSWRGGS